MQGCQQGKLSPNLLAPFEVSIGGKASLEGLLLSGVAASIMTLIQSTACCIDLIEANVFHRCLIAQAERDRSIWLTLNKQSGPRTIL